MQNKSMLFVGFAILVSIMAGCIPNFIPPIELSTTASPLEDPAIAVDINGNSHIAGVSNDRIVYQRLDKFGKIERTEVLESETFDVRQRKPDIAVTDDGTAWVVWVEEFVYKSACFTSIPISGDFDPNCTPLRYTAGETSSGFVRVVAKANTAYAVFDSVNEVTGKIKDLYYQNLVDAAQIGNISEYNTPFGTIYGVDIAIDSKGKLHTVFVDRGPDDITRLHYRSNVSVADFGCMNQIWVIKEGLGVDPNVTPKISFHYFNTSIESVIMAYEGGPGYYVYTATCVANGCGYKVSDQPVPETDLFDVTELDILGYITPYGYVVSFIGKETGDIYPQVYGWTSNMAAITQITDTDTNKSNLSMVAGMQAVIGFIEYIINIGPPPLELPFETATVMEYDLSHGLRSVFHTACLHTSNDRKLDMASAINLVDNIVPVAGVWNVCGETWFSTNVFINHLPLILR